MLARVPDMGSLPTGEPVAIVQVETRARVVAIDRDERGADVAEYEVLRDPRPSPSIENVARELRAVLELIADLRRSRRLPELLRRNLDPGALADSVALWAEFDDAARLAVLRAVDVAARLELVMAWARGHLAELQVAQSIRNDVSEGVDKQQREFLLRQQLAAIRKELGEGDDDVVGEYRARLDELDAPDGVRTAIDKELERLERTSTQSPEHSWIRTWLDRIFELPWNNRSDDTVDLDNAKRVLDDDHYGLDDVKDRIVEFLATRKLRHERGLDERESDSRRGNGAIVTLVGPPGVGKTSLGESVARAMGRKFVRIALGGIRDEAEIRGHRRTYVGSQPGRIVRALIEAGTMNPVVLLDEVDKLSAGGWSGDPTAALLEVLDPAQNHTFRDHYLEVDLDLSEVVFLATANVADGIPGPLLDRMDIIRLDGYIEDEKVDIAERYLLPRQRSRSGLARRRADRGRRRDRCRDPGLHPRGGCARSRARARPPRPQGGGPHRDRCGDAPDRRRLPTRRVARPPEGDRRRAGAHPAARRRDRPRGHRPRWRRAVHRDHRVPDRRWRRTRAHADRTARRRDEGVGPDRAQLRAVARRRVGHRSGVVAAPVPRPRPGGSGPEGRAVGRHHDGDRARQPAQRHARCGTRSG